MCKTLMALRLTCKALREMATRVLFRTFCLSPSGESWNKFHTIATSEKFRVHLQTLAVEGYHDCSWNVWHNCVSDNRQKMTTISGSTVFCAVDLSLLPNLKVLKAEDKWVVAKKARSNVQIPVGHCQVQAISFAKNGQQPSTWAMLGGIAEITNYDFQFFSLNCQPGFHSPWTKVDMSGLKHLRVYFKANSWNYPYGSPADSNLLAKLQHLPNLEEFCLDQSFHGRSDPIKFMSSSATNVLKELRAKHWPRLRHLDLRFLTTTVADFQDFLIPHAGTLKTFHLHGGLASSQVTPDERYYLPHWIRTFVCPRGGGAEFRYFLGQPEGWFVAEGGDLGAEEVEDSEEEEQGGGS